MIFSTLFKLALAVSAVAAQQCSPPPASSSSAPPPTGTGVAIHPNGNTNLCLDVQGNIQADGTPVQIYQCNGSGAQKWVIKRNASGHVQLAGTNFCLDASLANPVNGVKMKIWTCYDGLPAQEWYYTADNRIAVTGKGQCLDLTNGSGTNGNVVQVWQCSTGNNNQVWTS